jgi:hypothetical protein
MVSAYGQDGSLPDGPSGQKSGVVPFVGALKRPCGLPFPATFGPRRSLAYSALRAGVAHPSALPTKRIVPMPGLLPVSGRTNVFQVVFPA